MSNHRSYVINDQIIHVLGKKYYGADRYSKFHVINRMFFNHNVDINNNNKIVKFCRFMVEAWEVKAWAWEVKEKLQIVKAYIIEGVDLYNRHDRDFYPPILIPF